MPPTDGTAFSGGFNIKQPVTIDASALAIPLTIDASRKTTIFKIVREAGELKLGNLVLTAARGSAIQNSHATVRIKDCVLTDNQSDKRGGAINNWGGKVFLTNCLLSNNVGGDSGGAISSMNTESLLHVVKTTIYGNHAERVGGGIRLANSATAELIHCTIVGNGSDSGGGVQATGTGSTLHLESSIISGNVALGGGSDNNDVSGTGRFIAGGANLIGQFSNERNYSGPPPIPSLDPMLAPLGDYGGRIPTMPPVSGSPATNL